MSRKSELLRGRSTKRLELIFLIDCVKNSIFPDKLIECRCTKRAARFQENLIKKTVFLPWNRVIKMLITSECTWVIFPFAFIAIWWNIFYLNFRKILLPLSPLLLFFDIKLSSVQFFSIPFWSFSSSGWESELFVWVDITRKADKKRIFESSTTPKKIILHISDG